MNLQLLRETLDPKNRKSNFEQWKASLYEVSRAQSGIRWGLARAFVDRGYKCTGVSAGWCPNCGNCCCDREEGGPFDHPDCPLHAPDSPHAEGAVD